MHNCILYCDATMRGEIKIIILISYMKMHIALLKSFVQVTVDCCIMFEMCAATLFILRLAFHSGLLLLFPLLQF